MARTRFPADVGLSSRMLLTMFLLGLLYVVFVGVLISLVGNWFLVVLIAGGFLFFQYFFSDRIALYAMRGREVAPRRAPELHQMIDRLCALADMPKPRVAISDSDLPNAFATGRDQKHAVVCVTTGILRRLSEPELEAVLSHELSHVAHRDVAVMTIASFLLTRALSRYRELSADRAGAILIGRPSTLASALVKVSGEMARIPTRDLRAAEPLNAFFFAPALAPGFSFSSLFATHPPLQRRLDQLARLEAQLGHQA